MFTIFFGVCVSFPNSETGYSAKDFSICFPRILRTSRINLQISDTTADNCGTGGQWWTEKRGAPSGFSVRHEIKHLNIMKLWRGLKFTSQLQNKCFQFGATQASPKVRRCAGQRRNTVFHRDKRRHWKGCGRETNSVPCQLSCNGKCI